MTTNHPGKIRVEARRADNPTVTDATFVSPDISQDHAVRLTHLTPNQNYRLVGYILNHFAGDTYNAQNPIQLGDANPQVIFTTLSTTPVPTLTIDKISSTENTIVIPATVDKGYITVLLEAPSDPLRGTWKKVDTRGSVNIDKYGVVTGDPESLRTHSQA